MTTNTQRNSIEFRLWGRYALFTDPLTRMGGEKCSYHIPTYEALKGVAKSIYWKPTLIWVIDAVRVMKRIRTQTKGTKPQVYSGGNTLAIYTFLADVEYQVRAHFEWNLHRPELENDRNEGKHYAIAQRALERGGRQDIFLGTRDCQGYIEPCAFGSGIGELDNDGELGYSLMFHSFDYPDETEADIDGKYKLFARSWKPIMKDGVIQFDRPEDCKIRRLIREMSPKPFGVGTNQLAVEEEFDEWGCQSEEQS
ncbi:type I-C CRISPR-associated protein Cas5 [Betaproteobacteria bacterium]|nr:type I-C CRISPR-associated protein Cas5 [Betaproteobacteria bacterium]GHU25483.1 type I-C CRISPR-associated protein Cas5 [Betaproteobacteria bacterium]